MSQDQLLDSFQHLKLVVVKDGRLSIRLTTWLRSWQTTIKSRPFGNLLSSQVRLLFNRIQLVPCSSTVDAVSGTCWSTMKMTLATVSGSTSSSDEVSRSSSTMSDCWLSPKSMLCPQAGLAHSPSETLCNLALMWNASNYWQSSFIATLIVHPYLRQD